MKPLFPTRLCSVLALLLLALSAGALHAKTVAVAETGFTLTLPDNYSVSPTDFSGVLLQADSPSGESSVQVVAGVPGAPVNALAGDYEMKMNSVFPNLLTVSEDRVLIGEQSHLLKQYVAESDAGKIEIAALFFTNIGQSMIAHAVDIGGNTESMRSIVASLTPPAPVADALQTQTSQKETSPVNAIAPASTASVDNPSSETATSEAPTSDTAQPATDTAQPTSDTAQPATDAAQPADEMPTTGENPTVAVQTKNPAAEESYPKKSAISPAAASSAASTEPLPEPLDHYQWFAEKSSGLRMKVPVKWHVEVIHSRIVFSPNEEDPLFKRGGIQVQNLSRSIEMYQTIDAASQNILSFVDSLEGTYLQKIDQELNGLNVRLLEFQVMLTKDELRHMWVLFVERPEMITLLQFDAIGTPETISDIALLMKEHTLKGLESIREL